MLMEDESRMVSTDGGGFLRVQPKVAIRSGRRRLFCKGLKYNNFISHRSGRERTKHVLMRSAPSPDCRAAAIWRNLGAPNLATVPELDKECLSFVMPQKQGGTASGHGDIR